MIAILSPAKTLDFEREPTTSTTSEPLFLAEAEQLSAVLKEKSASELQALMSISDNLAELNAERFANWKADQSAVATKQAVLAFKGDVYQGLEATSFSETQLQFAQRHLRILSGMYGLLKPLDRIQPYRLEMGTKLTVGQHPNLYKFWGNTIAQQLNEDFKHLEHQVLINLASNEYFKAVATKTLKTEVITPVFKDYKGGKFKVISFYAKKARGLMAAFMIKNQLVNPEDLKAFQEEGYAYNAELSKANEWVFTRESA